VAEVTVDVVVREHGGKKVIKDLGDESQRTGKKFGEMGKEAGQLKKKIGETEAEVKKLIKAFDASGDVELLKSIRKGQSNLRLFERLRKSITDEAQEVGSDAGQKIGESLTLSMRSLRGPAIVGAIGLGALLAPAIGVAIQSAVIGGAGVGGIVGGIVAASQDQQVQTAAKLVGDHVGDELLRAGGAWVKPTIESLNILDAAGSRLADNFGKIGEKLGPVLPGLTGGATGALDNIMGGITRAANAMQPAIRALGTELPKIGDAIGDFFDEISKDPDQAVMGIVAISQAIQTTIDFSGKLLSTLGNLYEQSTRSGAAISGTMETLFGWLPVAGGAIERQGSAFREQVAAIDKARDASKDYVDGGIQPIIRAQEEVKKATKNATDAIKDQLAAMDKMFDRVLGAQELASNYQESIDSLTESVEENGKSLDLNNKHGRENAAALREQAEAIKAIRQDMIDKTGDVTSANKVFDDLTEKLRQQAYALGLNKQAVDAFIAALKGIPAQAEVEVRAPGLLDALNRARELNRLLGGAAAGARARPITIDGHFYEADTSGYGGGRASGGLMMPGNTYDVAESGTGVERVKMLRGGGAIVSNADQWSSGATMTGGAVGGAQNINLTLAVDRTGMSPLEESLVAALARHLFISGGTIGSFQIPRMSGR